MVERRLIGRGQVTIQDYTDSRTILAYLGSTLQRQVVYSPDEDEYTPDYGVTPIELVAELYVAGDTSNRISTAKEITWYKQEDSRGELIEIENDLTYQISGDSLIITTNVLKEQNSMSYLAKIVYPFETSEGTEEDMVVNASIELVKLSSGATGDTGTSGVGILDITEMYLATNVSEGVTIEDDGWTDNVQEISEDKRFLWNYEIIEYTDEDTNSTKPVVIGVHGLHGDHGVSIESITEYYLATDKATGITIDSSGWTNEVQIIDEVKKYLWNYEVVTYSEGDPQVMEPVILGVYGTKGDTGVGVKSTTVEYQAHTSGTTIPTESGWKEAVPNVKPGQYLWTRTIVEYTDDSTSTGYTVGKMGAQGDPGTDGDKGDTGVGVESTEVRYQTHTSGEIVPTGEWITDIPEVGPGHYLWTKTILEYTDESETTFYTIGKMGEQGDPGIDGDKGDTGVGVESTKVHYKAHASGTTVPSEEDWKEAVPNVKPGQYLWTRTTVKYTDGDSVVGYSVGKMGAQGSDGVKGDTGKGVDTTEIKYKAHTSGTAIPAASGWSLDIPEVKAGEYLWSRTTTTYTEGDPTVSYSVGKIGEQGIPGIEGKPGADALLSVLNLPDGDTIRNHDNNLTIEVNLYKGSNKVTPTTIRWYQLNPSGEGDGLSGKGWDKLAETKATLAVTPKMFSGTGTYLSIVTYAGKHYRNTTTVRDIVDTTVTIIGPNAFKNGKGQITLTAKVYDVGEEVDVDGEKYDYVWSSYDTQGNIVTGFKKTGKEVAILADEVDNIVSLQCIVTVK